MPVNTPWPHAPPPHLHDQPIIYYHPTHPTSVPALSPHEPTTYPMFQQPLDLRHVPISSLSPGCSTPRVNEPEQLGSGSKSRRQKRKGSGPDASGGKRQRGHGGNGTTTAASVTTDQSCCNGLGAAVPRTDDLRVFGVGPCEQSSSQAGSKLEPVPARYGSLLRRVHAPDADSSQHGAAASDVWFATIPVSSDEQPERPSELNIVKKSKKQPKTTYLACSFCLKKNEHVWQVWRNVDGQTDAIRTHFGRYHPEEWSQLIIAEKLKGHETIQQRLEECYANGTYTRPKAAARRQENMESFSMEGFYDRLVRWIAADDQSINVLDCPELRDLLLYLGTNLSDSDIPHRTKLGELISKRFQSEYVKMVTDIEESLGRVSFTSDLWTAQNSKSFMAVTAHYCAIEQGRLVLRSHLVAFRHVSGSHNGENLSKHFFEILKQIKALQRIGMITLDNASNCNTMMQDLQRLLKIEGINFDAEGNRIRCFPHVVNIAVQTGLKHLTQIDGSTPGSGNTITEVLKNNLEYLQILQKDIVSSARQLVTACRASGQRREDLSAVIQNGYEVGDWTREELRDVTLLRDVVTRWSSIYLMIDRMLELYPAISKLMELEKYKELRKYRLSNQELKVLDDIRLYLAPFHVVQEVVSAEKTPTLSIVLPLYEQLLEHVGKAKDMLPLLAHAMDESIRKLDEYLAESRKTRIYALAIVLNPTLKFNWIEEHWSATNVKIAREWIKNSMLEYRKHTRLQESQCQATPLASTTTLPSTSLRSSLSSASNLAHLASVPSSASSSSQVPSSNFGFRAVSTSSHAARAQTSGVARLKLLSRSYSSSSLSTTPSRSESESPSPSSRPSTPQDDAIVEERLAEQDRLTVELELEKYRTDGIIMGDEALADFDILLYWQANKHIYPLLYRLALDVLPAQASAVPCERVFSSGKDTDSARRSNLSTDTMETLQILKYLFRHERLSFDNGWCDTEDGLLTAEPKLDSASPES